MSAKTPPSDRPWHALSAVEVLEALKVDPTQGLSEAEARRRLRTYGPNLLVEETGPSALTLFLLQFRDVMVLVLLAATLVSFLVGEIGDALTIIVIVIVNAVLGFLQEERAERSLRALRELTAPTARVLRDGVEHRIEARDVVLGDILIIEAGDRPAADGRLIEAASLEAEEATLTGEDEAVLKSSSLVADASTPAAEAANMVFAGTSISSGRGRAVVVRTGMATEMGSVAALVQGGRQADTPLQRRLAELGKALVVGCLGLAALVVVTGILRGEDLYRMFLIGVTLAVAAIPEGLPAIVTVALAVGVQRMIRRHAVVRRLPAVETLGSATVICTDKTGTVTKNAMTVREVVLADGQKVQVTGEGYEAKGRIEAVGAAVREVRELLRVAVIASDGRVLRGAGASRPTAIGDPMEAAIWVASKKAGVDPETVRRKERLAERPFDAQERRMTVVVRDDEGGFLACEKGAPEVLLSACRDRRSGVGTAQMGESDRQQIQDEVARMSASALRCLAVAVGHGRTADEALGAPRTYLGTLGMVDPPRPEVRKAIARCRKAGIRPIMITGDHPRTAEAVAREVGLLGFGESVITGREIDALDDAAATRALQRTAVCARVSPRTKLRLVRLLRASGEVVAMTGDGVNDAPAVREADIGVAMGQMGSDVTKEASDLILTDDNFATIVAAVEEGRGIYDNVRKFVRYLLACNAGEILLMFFAALLGAPMPLIPIQILWVNLATDGLPALALGVDPIDPATMDRPPRPPGEGIFARRLGLKIVGRGFLIGLSTLGLFLVALALGEPLQKARTLAFATIVLSQLMNVFDVRSEDRSILESNPFSSPFLVLAVLSSVILLALAIYLPALRATFETWPLSTADWVAVIAVSGAASVTFRFRRRISRTRRVGAAPRTAGEREKPVA